MNGIGDGGGGGGGGATSYGREFEGCRKEVSWREN